MTKYYPAFVHNIVKTLEDVDYPVSKNELIERFGDKQIQNDFDSSILFKDLLEKMPLDEFCCAHEFYCNVNCALNPAK